MIHPSLDTLVTKVDSKYTLVTLAAKRAREVMDGDTIPSADTKSTKPVTIALEQIAHNLISYERTKTGVK